MILVIFLLRESAYDSVSDHSKCY